MYIWTGRSIRMLLLIILTKGIVLFLYIYVIFVQKRFVIKIYQNEHWFDLMQKCIQLQVRYLYLTCTWMN